MTRKINEKIKIDRAICRLKCGRGVNVSKNEPPKPQRGKNEVHIGTKTQKGGAYKTFNSLTEEEKKSIINSGLKNVRKLKRGKRGLPTNIQIKKLGDDTLRKLIDGIWSNKNISKDEEFKEIKELAQQTLENNIKVRRETEKRNRDIEEAEKENYRKKTEERRRDGIDKIKKRIREGDKRQQKNLVRLLNKKYGLNFVYTKDGVEGITDMKKKVKETAPKKEAPKKEVVKKVEPSTKGIKNDLLKILNKHYGGMIKYENKVLSGKLKDDSNEYNDEYMENEDNLDADLQNLFKKYKLSRDKGSEFFSSSNGMGMKIDQLIKRDKLDVKSLPNYKKLTEINKKLDEKASTPKKEVVKKTEKKEPPKKKVVKKVIVKTGLTTKEKLKESLIKQKATPSQIKKALEDFDKRTAPKKKEVVKKEVVKKEPPKKELNLKEVVKQMSEASEPVFSKKYDMKNLKKIVKNLEDGRKISDELTKIQKSKNIIQSKLRNGDILKQLKEDKDTQLSLVVSKQQYERRLKLIMKNLTKILST